MSDTPLMDQLDEEIDAVLATGRERAVSDPAVAELLSLAAELRTIPRPGFKAKLEADLLGQVAPIAIRTVSVSATIMPTAISKAARATDSRLASEMIPTLAGFERSLYPIQRSSFMASL